MLMKRTTLALALLLAFLFSVPLVTPHIGFASAQGSIIIKADGSVYPSTAPIQRDGNLYMLVSDVQGIEVQISSITLDGNGYAVEGWVGGIILKNVENVTVKNFIINAGQYGVSLSDCSNITISNNTIKGTKRPPFSYPTELTPEAFKETYELLIAETEFSGGIVIRGGNHDTIVGNRLENNFYGLNLEVANSTIIENNVVNNNCGIILWNASDNIFYHNNFIGNNAGVITHKIKSLQVNTWDDGSVSGGNYWSSNCYGVDANGDGISGTSYAVCSYNQDCYPLVIPWEPDNAAPQIVILWPESTTYTDGNMTLVFSIPEPTSKISYSIDSQENVTILGNTTLTDLSNGNHNLTVYATDKSGNTGTSETRYFSVNVPRSFLTTSVAAASVASVTIVVSALTAYFVKIRKKENSS